MGTIHLVNKRYMDQKSSNDGKLALILGVLGFLAGIVLLFSGNMMIGAFGAIASAGVAIKGYSDLKK